MSLSSLVAAAQTALEMSEAAAEAAEDAMHAAKLAGVHAQAALAAAKLALELDQKIRTAEKTNSEAEKRKHLSGEDEIERVLNRELIPDRKVEGEADTQDAIKMEGTHEHLNSTFFSNSNRKENFFCEEESSLFANRNHCCKNCNLHYPCLNGKFLLHVKEKTRGMKVKTCGSSWPETMLGRVGAVEGGDKFKVKIRWISSNNETFPIIANYNYYNIRGEEGRKEYAFIFFCDDEEKKHVEQLKKVEKVDGPTSSLKKWCLNCKLRKSKCLNEKFLLTVLPASIGMNVKACGSFWSSNLLNKKATILEGIGALSGSKVKIRWLQSGEEETHFLMTNGKYKFMFDCNSEPGMQLSLSDVSDISSDELRIRNPTQTKKFYTVNRLPYRKIETESWAHHSKGEKHRIRFCASENIDFLGVGLLVCEDIERVTVTLLHQLEQREDHSVLATGEFHNVKKSCSTVTLKLTKPLSLSCDRIYLLVVNLFGGASIVGHGGEEFITVERGQRGEPGDLGGNVLFKFEDFKQDKTTVEKGVIEKIFFHL